MTTFSQRIHPYVNAEVEHARIAELNGNPLLAFTHLERAHVLGQASTREHVRVHWLMFLWGFKRRNVREVLGQLTRIIGAATKTAIGWVPSGNTGGSNINPFKRLPVAPELAAIITSAKGGR